MVDKKSPENKSTGRRASSCKGGSCSSRQRRRPKSIGKNERRLRSSTLAERDLSRIYFQYWQEKNNNSLDPHCIKVR